MRLLKQAALSSDVFITAQHLWHICCLVAVCVRLAVLRHIIGLIFKIGFGITIP
jgi:hypothetical protein